MRGFMPHRSTDGRALNPWWKRDSAAVKCCACRTKFSTFKRKVGGLAWSTGLRDSPVLVAHERQHHCRRCGEIFCNSCTKRRLSLPHLNYGQRPVRACERCYAFRSVQLPALKTGIMVKQCPDGEGRSEVLHMKLTFQEEDSLRLTWRSLERVEETNSVDFHAITEIVTTEAEPQSTRDEEGT